MNSRGDFETIAAWITPGASVLDLGCGDGTLLAHLAAERGATGYGVEIDVNNIAASIANGVNVIQRDLEAGLNEFEDGSFDFVILSQTLQAMRNVERIVREMLRVGREGIVTFPNFGYWKHRVQISLRGRMPVSENLPYQWYDTPNIHLCTLDDFTDLCLRCGAEILEQRVLQDGRVVGVLPNLLGSLGVFRFRRANGGAAGPRAR
jgi:methionine biosynthesis protein MetW